MGTHEGDGAAYRANGPDRCFHCKDELFTRISDEVRRRGTRLDAVAYGENADDARRPDRPGAQAATEHRVLRPLADAGLDKADVRRVARALGLPCADKPAAPCLASRIPHHEPVTRRSWPRSRPPRRPCGRSGSPTAACATTATSPGWSCPRRARPGGAPSRCASDVHRAVVGAGFRFVAVDLAGIQSGAFTLRS